MRPPDSFSCAELANTDFKLMFSHWYPKPTAHFIALRFDAALKETTEDTMLLFIDASQTAPPYSTAASEKYPLYNTPNDTSGINRGAYS